jgi:hypothetical protein
MNNSAPHNNEPFIPAWVEASLQNGSSAKMELDMLRDFYESWEAFHSIPNIQGNRKKLEVASQVMVDAAHAIRAFKGATPKIERM